MRKIIYYFHRTFRTSAKFETLPKLSYYCAWLLLLALCVQCTQDDMKPMFANKKKKCLPTKIVEYYNRTNTTAKGKVTYIEYDGRGNITKVSYSFFDTSKSKDTTYAESRISTRDLKGRISEINFYKITKDSTYLYKRWAISYNLKSQPVKVERTLSDASDPYLNGYVNFEFDDLGRLTKFIYVFKNNPVDYYRTVYKSTTLENYEKLNNQRENPIIWKSYNLDTDKYNPYYLVDYAEFVLFDGDSHTKFITKELLGDNSDYYLFNDFYSIYPNKYSLDYTKSEFNDNKFPKKLTYKDIYGININLIFSYLCDE